MNAKNLQVGQKVKFDNENIWFTVKAVRHPYVICHTLLFGKGYYTILDVEKNIRGTGTSWGLGHETDEQIAESMLALHNEHPAEIEQEISSRNRVPLVIVEIKESNKFDVLSAHIKKALVLGQIKADQTQDGGTANLDCIVLHGLNGIRETTLRKHGINCSKYSSLAGHFVLDKSFGQGDKNVVGLKAAREYLKEQNILCFIHSQID